MGNKKYLFRLDKKFLKQGYILYDENNEIIFEAKMSKFGLFKAFKFEFVNHINNETVEHAVGHTITREETTGGIADIFSTKSWFKFDGKNIWDYLHEKGVRIDSNISKGSIGMTYTISLKGQEIASIAMVNPSGNNLIVLNHYCYDITTSDEYIELSFLIAFAFARTEQAFYD